MLELDCDITPRTCTNFLGLVTDGKYDGAKFHRSIKKFMIQCGSKKKDSFFGGPFKDEFDDRLTHNERGVIAMANAGANTNRDQFYITFGNASHLDRKHTVFGRLIDGFDVLDTIESIPTDKKDRPFHEVKILNAEVAIDPSEEAVKAQLEIKTKKEEKKQLAKIARVASALGTGKSNESSSQSKASTSEDSTPLTEKEDRKRSIGRYLPMAAFGELEGKQSKQTVINPGQLSAITEKSEVKQSTKKAGNMKFGDFSSW